MDPMVGWLRFLESFEVWMMFTGTQHFEGTDSREREERDRLSVISAHTRLSSVLSRRELVLTDRNTE